MSTINVGNVNTNSVNGGQLAGFRNKIINGAFEVWQRGTSSTVAGFIADRWRHTPGLGGAMTISRQEFTLGQTDVPGAKYFLRHDQTTAFSNFSYDRQRIEDVHAFAGDEVTLSWYMKADAARTVAIDVTQNFGTGGSPSSDVVTRVGTQAVTTSWQRYTKTFTVASISGKTLGSNGDSFLEVEFDYDQEVGNTFTIDIALVQLELGSTATPFEQRGIGTELALCQRYFQRVGFETSQRWYGGRTESTSASTFSFAPTTIFRTVPTISKIGAGTVNINDGTVSQTYLSFGTNYSTANHVSIQINTGATLTNYRMIFVSVSAVDTGLHFDAEL